VTTPKGKFLVSAVGKWTQGEALDRVLAAFKLVKLPIQELKMRKLLSDDPARAVTLLEPEGERKPAPGMDFIVCAGEGFWRAVGRLAEYQAEKALLEKQWRETGSETGNVPELLKLGDRVSYQGVRRFCLRTWACRKFVKPGDIGVVVESGGEVERACGQALPPWPWWKVDFGEGRVVTITLYNLERQQYRKEER
jgi:hypothetical protein